MKPIRVQPYKASVAKTAICKELVNRLIDKQILSPCTSEWGFGVVVVPKPHPSEESKEGKDVEDLWRFCCDLRPLNAHIPQDTYEPPNCSSCLQWLAGKKYRTVMDLRWGFYHCLLSEATKKISTMIGIHQ